MFIVICMSCEECDSMAVGLFAAYPTDEQIAKVKETVGDMWCIGTKIYELSEGEIVEDFRVIYRG